MGGVGTVVITRPVPSRRFLAVQTEVEIFFFELIHARQSPILHIKSIITFPYREGHHCGRTSASINYVFLQSITVPKSTFSRSCLHFNFVYYIYISFLCPFFLSYSITFPPCGYLDFRTTTKIKYFCGGDIITTDKLQQVAREIDLILVTKLYLWTLKNRRTNVGPATRAIHRPTIGRHVDITEEPRAIISTCSVGARRVVLR